MKKVLIVDDSATMRKIVMRALRQSRVDVGTVLEAANGVEALRVLGENRDCELVFSDVNMPEMNGLELVKSIRSSHSKEALPIVMITTEGGESAMQTALASGANGYVTKPFTPDALRSSLESILG